VIVKMAKVRILGPLADVEQALRCLQDLGAMHLAEPATGPELGRCRPDGRESREERQVGRVLAEVEAALALLVSSARPERANRSAREGQPPDGGPVFRDRVAQWARTAHRVRRRAEELEARRRRLGEEGALLSRYRALLDSPAIRALLRRQAGRSNLAAFLVLLSEAAPDDVDRLRAALAGRLGDGFELVAQPLPTGETALLVVTTPERSAEMEHLLGQERLEEIPLPTGFDADLEGGGGALAALPRMVERLREIPTELAATEAAFERLVAEHGDELTTARAALHERLLRLEALERARCTARAFVLEGWVPEEVRPRLVERLRRELGEAVLVETLSREDWSGEEAPVELHNPLLFKPFERLVQLVPLPRYGTIDPTPFLAVFFPMFFGLILGDIGYGAVLAAIGLILEIRGKPGSLTDDIARIAGACALFTIVFGVAYGELFGDLGHRWLGLEPLLFDRGEALVPFLGLALSLGLVHLLLGLGLAAFAGLRRHRPREALGPGLAAVMLALVAIALMATFHVLPDRLFTPAVIALLVVFPILVLLEGVAAPIELLSTLGRVLSYARIMALGTASVFLAVVANRMAGALGSALVGAVFALLFHLVNFAIGVFSPTIHALRLHYVEFFGTFYSPGGTRYRPFAHWRGEPSEAASRGPKG